MLDKKEMWDNRFMTLTKEIAKWSSCLRREVGAIIVKNNRILATGYNGAPQDIMSCKERNTCLRNELNIESGTHAEICYAIHAEQNAVIQAAKMGISIDGATIYVTHRPCSVCARILINAGIKRVVYDVDYPDDFTLKLFKQANVEFVKYEPKKEP